LGCDSIDGSGFSRWPDARIPLAMRWLADLHGTPSPEYRPSVNTFLEAKTSGLLDEPGWMIQRVSLRQGRYFVHARLALEPERCRHCFTEARIAGSVYRHGTTSRRFRDLPRNGRPVTVLVEQQRYHCRVCRQTFLQPLPGSSDRGQLSIALSTFIRDESLTRSRSEIARLAGVDEKTVRNHLQGLDKPAPASATACNASGNVCCII